MRCVTRRQEEEANDEIGIVALVISFRSTQPTEAAERWSPEQREVLEQIEKCWGAWAEAAEAKDFSIWESACPASDDILWWWTPDAVPSNRQSLSRQFSNWHYIERVVWWDVRPIEINIIGEIAVIPFYSRGSWLGTDGKQVDFSSKRVELFRNVDGRWVFLGGMVDPRSTNALKRRCRRTTGCNGQSVRSH